MTVATPTSNQLASKEWSSTGDVWVRPSEWPALTPVGAAESKFELAGFANNRPVFCVMSTVSIEGAVRFTVSEYFFRFEHQKVEFSKCQQHWQRFDVFE